MSAGPQCFGIPRQEKSVYSQIYVDGGNGYGSSATNIRRFSTLEISRGGDITYTDDPANGAMFKIGAQGLYQITYSDAKTTAGSCFVGVSVSTTLVTTGITSLTFAQGFRGCVTSNASGTNAPEIYSNTLLLYPNDVVRAHTDALANSTGATQVWLNIIRVT